MEAKDQKHDCIKTVGSQTFFFNCGPSFTIPSTRGPTHKKTPVAGIFWLTFVKLEIKAQVHLQKNRKIDVN